MLLYKNLANNAITTDLGTLQSLDVNNPVIAKRGDSPTLQLEYHYNGAPTIPASPLITVVVKKVNDFDGPTYVFCDTYTPPSGGSFFFQLLPDLTAVGAGSLFEALLTTPVVARPANQTARFALTGLAIGAVVQQVDTGAYWQVTDPTQLGNTAGWSTDVSMLEEVTFACEICTQQSPAFGKQTSQTFMLQVQSPYFQGNETAPTGGSKFGQGIVLNLFAVTNLIGGAAGDLDFVATAAGQVLPCVIAVLNLTAGPYVWRLKKAAAIVSSSVATDTVITTQTPHGLAIGQGITIGDHAGSTPAINGNATVLTVPSPTTFTIAVDVTVAGAGGFVTPATTGVVGTGGIVRPIDFDAAANPVFWQSVF